MPIIQTGGGEEGALFFVTDKDGQTIAGPYSNRQMAEYAQQSFPASVGAGGQSAPEETEEYVPEYGLIGGQEFLLPQVPLGITPAAEALMQADINLPAYEVAGLSPEQEAGLEMVRSGAAGAGIPGVRQGLETTGVAADLALGAGLDPFAGFGGTAEDYIDLGGGVMSLGAGTTMDVTEGIPGLLETGEKGVRKGMRDVRTSGKAGQEVAEEARSGILGALTADDLAVEQAREDLATVGAGLAGLPGETRAGLEGALALGGEQLGAATAGALREAGAADVAAGLAQTGAAAAAGRAAGAGVPILGGLSTGLGDAAALAGEQAFAGQAGLGEATERARQYSESAARQLERSGEFGLSSAASGLTTLKGAGDMFDPASVSGYMNPYEQAVIDQVMEDIGRKGMIQRQMLASRAVEAGAFGGSRQGLAEQELARNILREQAVEAGKLRSAGYADAMSAAEQAFENARQRQLSAASAAADIGAAGSAAGTAAAEAMGGLGIEAETLAQTGAVSGAQLGLSVADTIAANARALAETGLSLEELAANTGLTAAEIAGEFGIKASGVGLTATEQQAANARALMDAGMSLEQISAETGLTAAQLEQAGITSGAELATGQVGQTVAGQEAAGSMGMEGASLGITAGQTTADIGLAGSGQQLEGASTQLTGAGQAADIGQGIGSLGVSAGNLGLGAAGQEVSAAGTVGQLGGQQGDLSSMLQNMSTNEINAMLAAGTLTQTQLQNEIDAGRLTAYQEAMAPFQQVGFAADIASGSPMGSTVTQTQPGPDPAGQALGYGLTAAATYNLLS